MWCGQTQLVCERLTALQTFCCELMSCTQTQPTLFIYTLKSSNLILTSEHMKSIACWAKFEGFEGYTKPWALVSMSS